MGDWLKRPYEPESDERLVVSQWLKSYAHSAYGKHRGAFRAASPEELSYWDEQAPLVEMLLRSCDCEVIADPDRPRASSDGPAVLWAFAVTSGDVIHYVSVKHRVVKAGFGAEVVRDLLGDRLNRPCGYTHELVEMRTGRCGVRLPLGWYSDPTWLARSVIGPRKRKAA